MHQPSPRYYLLLAYTSLTSMAAAYLMAFGFGKSLRLYMDEGTSTVAQLALLALEAAVCVVLLLCMLNGRRLLPYFKFELSKNK